MRLIDADKVVEIMKEYQEHSFDGKINIESVLYLLSIQNTAFNIDKVVKELEEEIVWVDQWGKRFCNQKRAIEIVKAGGKNE